MLQTARTRRASPTLRADHFAGVERYVAAAPSGIDGLLPLLSGIGDVVPQPGAGGTLDRLSVLASVASVDVVAARVLEPHLDALATLHEAGMRIDEPRSWGVFAAEVPGTGLTAGESDAGWTLSGVKPWCSLGDRLDAALVTANVGDARRLFMVDLRSPRVTGVEHGWQASGLREIDSGPLSFDDAPATALGGDGWYLQRPGFEWGGIGVAAIWWGGALPLCTAVSESAGKRGGGALMEHRVGQLWQAMDASRALLEHAAQLIDSGEQRSRDEWAVTAHSVRSAAAAAVDDALDALRDVAGPAALTFDGQLARRHADLQLYTAQYHRLRDPGAIGRRVLEGSVAW